VKKTPFFKKNIWARRRFSFQKKRKFPKSSEVLGQKTQKTLKTPKKRVFWGILGVKSGHFGSFLT